MTIESLQAAIVILFIIGAIAILSVPFVEMWESWDRDSEKEQEP